MRYAEKTEVSVEKTRAELETVLRQYGADAFGYMADSNKAMITFRAQKRFVRFVLPLPSPDDKRFTHWRPGNGYSWAPRKESAARALWEQACRSSWRSLFLAVKAKLVAVQAGITTFEQEFLAHIVLPDGQTAGEMMIPQIVDSYETGRMPKFQLSLPEKAS